MTTNEPLPAYLVKGDDAVLRAEDAAAVRPAWDEIVGLISGKLVFRD